MSVEALSHDGTVNKEVLASILEEAVREAGFSMKK